MNLIFRKKTFDQLNGGLLKNNCIYIRLPIQLYNNASSNSESIMGWTYYAVIPNKTDSDIHIWKSGDNVLNMLNNINKEQKKLNNNVIQFKTYVDLKDYTLDGKGLVDLVPVSPEEPEPEEPEPEDPIEPEPEPEDPDHVEPDPISDTDGEAQKSQQSRANWGDNTNDDLDNPTDTSPKDMHEWIEENLTPGGGGSTIGKYKNKIIFNKELCYVYFKEIEKSNVKTIQAYLHLQATWEQVYMIGDVEISGNSFTKICTADLPIDILFDKNYWITSSSDSEPWNGTNIHPGGRRVRSLWKEEIDLYRNRYKIPYQANNIICYLAEMHMYEVDSQT
jgi:hypothetical protein